MYFGIWFIRQFLIAAVHISLQSSDTYPLDSPSPPPTPPPEETYPLVDSWFNRESPSSKVLFGQVCVARPRFASHFYLDSHCATLSIPAVGHVSCLGEEDEALLARGCDSLCPASDLAGNTGIRGGASLRGHHTLLTGRRQLGQTARVHRLPRARLAGRGASSLSKLPGRAPVAPEPRAR